MYSLELNLPRLGQGSWDGIATVVIIGFGKAIEWDFELYTSSDFYPLTKVPDLLRVEIEIVVLANFLDKEEKG